jgi:DNA-binding IclR family transcriptional regulator
MSRRRKPGAAEARDAAMLDLIRAAGPRGIDIADLARQMHRQTGQIRPRLDRLTADGVVRRSSAGILTTPTTSDH